MNFKHEKEFLPDIYIPSEVKKDIQPSQDHPITNQIKNHVVNKSTQLARNNQPKQGNHFCVIVGKEYVLKVIALQQSLIQNTKEFTLWICCIDSFAYSILVKLNLNNVILLQVEELEDERLKNVKKNRKVNEYCWTLKAVLIEYLLVNYNLSSVLYCDGDLFFFADPSPIFDEWGDNSVFLCPQRDRDWVEQKYGKYQAGLIGFKNDVYGLKSVRWWKEKCLDWCSAEPNRGRFGDQKYLDYIPIYFPKVKISRNLGINAAPWNCIYNNDYNISKNLNEVYIETDKLVVYHFACITIFSENDFDLWSLGEISIPNNILDCIYTPYLNQIQLILEELKPKIGEQTRELLSTKEVQEAQTLYKDSQLRRKMNQWGEFLNFSLIISREYLIKGLTCYYSLEKQGKNFNVWICCMDDLTYRILTEMELKNAILIHVKEIENKELLDIKDERSLQEYCWTLKAPLCLHIFNYYSEVDHIIYCDADMYFFSNPNVILDEWWKYSVFLCPQRGTTELESVHGMYQAGLIGFKNDKNSKDILNWWKDKCLEYCRDIYDVEFNRWGDQKYLNHIPDLFSNIKIMNHKGIDAAPWNLILNNHDYVRREDNKVFVDNDELVAFHFGSMQIFNTDEFDLWKQEAIEIDQSILENIYIPYIEKIRNTCHILRNTFRSPLTPLYVEISDNPPAKNYVRYPSFRLKQNSFFSFV
ncbi:glycosyl transferase [Bacillus sp. DX4.1]|uniref:glycosyl transferase n=1 Tax=Bacillus sp. DX4.1 TaxID=3055867 RepID=UPI0025A09D8F|nr:glycosyl transferase [Bacillus sp. DX4.1]MDM5188748.1 glycosyl transferase [Bacillus sp. DX4.1]